MHSALVPMGGRAGWHRRLRVLAPLLLTASLAGCAVGPTFRSPSGLPHGSAREAPGVQWWKAFGVPALDSVIAQALEASPTLAAAEATLRQAQEVYSAQAGSTRYPLADATLGTQRQRLNPGALGQPGDPREFTLLNATVGVRYKLDLAGGNRRALEALAARADYRRYQLDGARLTLAANLASTAIAQARLSAQVEGLEAMLRDADEQLALSRERVRLGAASPDEVLLRQLQAEQSRAGVPAQRKLLQQNEHLLAVLSGRAPGAGGMPVFELSAFELPGDLPLVVPSELVRRRPDIRAAEALLHAANAEYGVAVAKLYPQLNLSANLGSQALSTGVLFGSGSAVWLLLGQLTQPLLNPGLPAEKRAALAAFEAAAANYQGVVLESLRNVADVLRALDHDAQSFTALATADTAAQGALASVQRQYALGAASWVQVLSAREQAQQVRLGLVAARAQRLVDAVALYQAVGGGGAAPVAPAAGSGAP